MNVTVACIVFDFDGVLVDSNSIKREAYYDIFSGIPEAAEIITRQLKSSREWDRFSFVQGVVAALGRSADAQFYAEEYGRYCHDRTVACAEVAGVSSCMPDLASRWPLYVNSATPEKFLREIVAQRGWSSWFKGVYGGPASKVENLERIRQEQRISRNALLFVGDGERDRSAAEVFGCPFVGMKNSDNDFVTTPSVLVGDLSQLSTLLGGAIHA